jgi:membrane-bound ClpP family serine protease
VVGVLASLALVRSAGAQAPAGGPRPSIDVVQVGGILDPINVELVRRSIIEAPARGTTAVVIQLDSAAA